MDAYDLWRDHQAEQDRWLMKRPVCERCGEPIQDEELWDINGTIYCDECARYEFLKETEDYEE